MIRFSGFCGLIVNLPTAFRKEGNDNRPCERSRFDMKISGIERERSLEKYDADLCKICPLPHLSAHCS